MCLVLQLRMKWMREQLKIKMSDKTKVLSRNLKTKLFYDNNQELDLKKKTD